MNSIDSIKDSNLFTDTLLFELPTPASSLERNPEVPMDNIRRVHSGYT